jgi:O-antigen ligase
VGGLGPDQSDSRTVLNQGSESGSYLIFYDAATPQLAGAVVLGLIFSRQRLRKLHWLLLGAAGVIVILSLRRNIWLALLFALVVGIIVSRKRALVGRRSAAIVVPALLAAPLLSSGFLDLFGARVRSIVLTFRGVESDSSAGGHVSDIELGWLAAKSHSLLGLGPEAPPLAGAVVESSKRLYVHNEYLQTWLLFGLPGLALLTGMVLAMIVLGVRVLRMRDDARIYELAAAFFLIATPVALNAAPYFTGSSRWMLLTGGAAGVCANALGRLEHGIVRPRAGRLHRAVTPREAHRDR